MAQDDQHLPPIAKNNKPSSLTGSRQSIASFPEAGRKISFARVSRDHAAGATLAGSKRSLSQLSLPTYTTHPGSGYGEPNRGTSSLGSGRQRKSAVLLPDVSRTDLLKKNFLRLKSSSAVNVSTGSVVWPNGTSRLSISPRPIRRCHHDSSVLLRSRVHGTMSQSSGQPASGLRQETMTAVLIDVGACRKSKQLPEVTRLAELTRAPPAPTGGASGEPLSEGEVTTDSMEGSDQSEAGLEAGDQSALSEQTLNKCIDWLRGLEDARTRYSLDAVVETPVQWRD